MDSEQFFQVRHAVFLLESVSQRDLAEGRAESAALAPALRLAGVPVYQYQVGNRADLLSALEEASRIGRIDGYPVVPTIHISAHGNSDGLRLTDGSFIPWAELRQILLGFAHACGLIPRGLGLVGLSMSTCEGAFAARMFDLGPPYPCIGIVGPTAPVAWTDSLVAYVTLYHLTTTKGVILPNAIGPMNSAAGSDLFRLHTPADGAERISEGGMSLAREFARRSIEPGSSAPT